MIYKQKSIQRRNRTFPFLIAGFFAIAVIGVSIWFLRFQTVTAPHAAAATTLSFNNTTQTVMEGQVLSSDIIVNPGTNQVSVVKLSIAYDGSKLQDPGNGGSLTLNPTAFQQTLQSPTVSCTDSQCIISATYSISDPIHTIQQTTTVATVHLKAIAPTTGTPAQITFDAATKVFSVATNDKASENVLAATNPLAVTIAKNNGNTGGGNTCQMNQSTCSWDSMQSATKYHYKVLEVQSGNTIQEDDVTSPQTSITFPSQPGKTYTCTVTAANACAQGVPGKGTSTCPAPSITPTPTICVGPGTVANLHITCPNCAGQTTNQ